MLEIANCRIKMNFTNLLCNYAEAVSMILFAIGFCNLLMQKNLIKKIIGLNIMDSSVYLFLALKGYIVGKKALSPRICLKHLTSYVCIWKRLKEKIN